MNFLRREISGNFGKIQEKNEFQEEMKVHSPVSGTCGHPSSRPSTSRTHREESDADRPRWNRFVDDFGTNLYASMDNRMVQVIQRNGGMTDY